MRPLNTLATATLAIIAVFALGACGKKKTSSAASTPASACIYNQYTGQYTTSTGAYCNPAAQQNNICPSTGIYTPPTGGQMACTPGQPIPYYGNGYTYPGQYPGQYSQYMNTGCDSYYYQYGVQYVPVVLQGQLMCVRGDVLAQYSQGTNYGYNYNYYYAYPPYQYTGSGYCGTQIGVSFGGFSGALCF